MNRIKQLEDICKRIGVFSNGRFGVYGNLILNQIKTQWANVNVSKYPNIFILNSVDMFDNRAADVAGSKQFIESIKSSFSLNKLPIGIINVVESEPTESFQQSLRLFKNANRMTSLNFFYLTDSKANSLTQWQTERRRWWTRHLQSPHNLDAVNKNGETGDQFKLQVDIKYKIDQSEDLCERLCYYDDYEKLNNQFFTELHQAFNATSNKKTDILMSQTTCENILERVMLDSVSMLSKEELARLQDHKLKPHQDPVFSLDFRLAPFKACILLNSSQGKLLVDVADDLKKKCYLQNINMFLLDYKNDQDLESKFKHLDLMGVPFSIQLQAQTIEDGVCLVRNRDTGLQEQMHVSRVANNFRSFAESLNF